MAFCLFGWLSWLVWLNFPHQNSFLKEGFRKDTSVNCPRLSFFYIQIYFYLFVKLINLLHVPIAELLFVAQ